MAEEFVRKAHMDERFLSVEKRMEQGFAHAEKAREQNAVHLGERFADLKKSVNQRFDSLDKRLAFQNRIMLGLLSMLLAGLVKYLFFQ